MKHAPFEPAATVADRMLPFLVMLFVGSGCSALIYEVVWFQLLQLVIGSSAVSLGVLLGTFMGGMCLGSLLLPRVVPTTAHPLKVYAALELGIGLIGIAILYGMPAVDRLYTASAVGGVTGIAIRAVVAAACLLPPTVLMGATLPAVARWVETTPRGVSWLGFFYGGNIAGAVFGCLLAGFYLLRVHDMEVATCVAAAVNIVVGGLGFALACVMSHRSTPKVASASLAEGEPSAWPVYLAIGLSGFCALGAEVVWTRLLSLLLGATVYTFSIILAVFLSGLGIGSTVGAALSRTVARPAVALGWCQMALAVAVAWAAAALNLSLPWWPINPSLSTSPWFNFQLDLARSAWAVLPAACLWGASFPLALAAAAGRGRDPGRLVGGVYAANTLGAIAGALAYSLLFIGRFGTQQSERWLIVLSAVAGLVAISASFRRALGREEPTAGPAAGAAITAATAVAAALAWTVPALPWELVAYGRQVPTSLGRDDLVWLGEGMNSSVAVTQTRSGVRNFHVSGKIEASSEPQDMRLQRMLGHLPALIHPNPKTVLVVGCGAGVTAGSFVPHPSVERIVICEIEPLIPQVVARHFKVENHDVVNHPKVTVVHDDARHYVLTTRETFDIITSDPIHPWVKGAATLYTAEYFEMCKRKLNPGGVVTQWVPLYESTEAVVKSEVATFCEAFPDATIWGNDIDGQGYDVVLLGRTEKSPIDIDALQVRLDRPDHAAVVDSIQQVGLGSAVSLLATYAGRTEELRPWLTDAEINRDRNLRLQYLAGMGVNSSREVAIYSKMLEYRSLPDELFGGSGPGRAALRRALGKTAER